MLGTLLLLLLAVSPSVLTAQRPVTYHRSLEAVVLDVVAEWETAVGDRFEIVGPSGYADRDRWAQDPAIPPNAVHLVEAPPGRASCSRLVDGRKWCRLGLAGLSESKARELAMHELGHVLGIGPHIDDGLAVMRTDPAGTCPGRTHWGYTASDVNALGGALPPGHVDPKCMAPVAPPPEGEEDNGYDRGYEDGYGRGYDDGQEHGYDRGYDDGHEQGYETGWEEPRRRCSVDGTTLDLHGGVVRATMEVFVDDAVPSVVPEACSKTSGVWSWYSPDDWQLLVKVLNGCSENGHWWVFVSAATDREWTVTVTIGDLSRRWLGGPNRRTWFDTRALPCDGGVQ